MVRYARVGGLWERVVVHHVEPVGFEEAVRAAICRLAPGEVASYGDIAEEAGRPGAARAVGAVLARSDGQLPWWRVVTASGRLVPGHEREHARRLAAEGVPVRNGRVPVARRRPPAGSAGVSP